MVFLEDDEDTGLDGCVDETEDGWGGCLESGTYNDFLISGETDLINPSSDVDSQDPNGDNWNAIDSTGTEGNDLLDDGEEWFDWGLDGIQDSLEAFQESSVISIEQYDNKYIFDLSE